MKLQAVTICINYADFLSAVVENRHHFDRWIIVTASYDIETQKICARYGIESIISRHLQPDGKGFHAVNAKWPLINEALELLEQTGWALVLDADVFLPKFFRQRLEGLSLKQGCLYGVTGRKVIEDFSSFEQLRRCEPWTTLVKRNSRVLGYFNLFSLETIPNRYLVREPGDDDRSHDDIRFSSAFDSDRLQLLPMSVIHVGKPFKNWTKRRTPEFETSLREHNPQVVQDMLDAPGLQKTIAKGQFRTAAVIGYFPGGRWRQIATLFSQTYLVDHFLIHTVCGNRLAEQDRAVLRQLLGQEAETLTGLHFVGEHSEKNIDAIPEGSINLLYLSGEVAPDWMPQALQRWLPKLSEQAMICGDLFGLPQWKEASFTIALLLGTPDKITAEGFWWKRWSAGGGNLHFELEKYSKTAAEMGVILIALPRTAEKLLVTLYSLRLHWFGPVVVYCWGDDNPSLTIAATKLNVDLYHLGEPLEDDEARARFIDILVVQPFQRTLALQPGMITVRSLSTSFDKASPTCELNLNAPILAVREQNSRINFSEVRSIRSSVFTGNNSEPEILLCSGDSATWTDAAWEAWSVAESDLTQRMAVEVRTVSDATIVTIVSDADVGDFQRNWLSWKFPANTSTLVILVDIPLDAVWLPGVTTSTRVVSLSRARANDLPWLLSWIAEQCQTSRIVFLPATVAALPGAELWFSEDSNPEIGAKLGWSRVAKEEGDLTGNLFVPVGFFGILDHKTLKNVAATPESANTDLGGLPLLMHKALNVETSQRWIDVGRQGWKGANIYQYISSRPPLDSDRVKICKNANGEWLLADDVVVISLPERMDRRRRIDTMLRQYRVSYNFVDGVRVSDDEINPAEISGVDLHTFKLAPTFIRGTVGCRRAHLNCLERAYQQGLNSFLIIEDDMHFVDDWFTHYQLSLTALPPGWLQLYLSAAAFRPSEFISKSLSRLAGAYQTTAILYSRAGIEATLKCLRRSNCEIDVWMSDHLHPFGCSYLVHPMIAYQQSAGSDIMGVNRGITP